MNFLIYEMLIYEFSPRVNDGQLEFAAIRTNGSRANGRTKWSPLGRYRYRVSAMRSLFLLPVLITSIRMQIDKPVP